MTVTCLLVHSIRIVASVQGTRKRAEAFSLDPYLLIGIYLRSLESTNPVWCSQPARTIIASDTGAEIRLALAATSIASGDDVIKRRSVIVRVFAGIKVRYGV